MAPCIVFFDEIDALVRIPGLGDDAELIRYFNQAVEGLNLLYGAADAGISGAKAIPHAEADRPLERGGRRRDAKYSKRRK